MKFTAANCTVLVDEQGKGTIVCDVENNVAAASLVEFSPEARSSAEKRLMAKRKKKSAKKSAKKKQSFCEGVMKSCRKRGKAKTPFCKSALKSCRKKARKSGGKKARCPKGRVTRGKRKGLCRK